MQTNRYFVYMLASTRGVLYTGMTRDISVRVEQHRSGGASGFSSKYKTNKLVWCESAESFEAARDREKEIKGWRRSKKADLIEKDNPYLQDISPQIG